MNGPDTDPEYWQTYGVMIGIYSLYNLRVLAFPWLVSIDGILYPSPPSDQNQFSVISPT